MDVNALNKYIRQEIRQELYDDLIEFYLPFFFGNDEGEPLRLIWDHKGILSDGGRTLTELKKRIGDLTPYQDTIQNIVSHYGTVSLEGGQKLVVRDFQTCISGEKEYKDYAGGLSRLLQVISQISAIDMITVDTDGTVSVC